MPLVRAELETCPVCNATGKLQIHSYYKRYLIDFIAENVSEMRSPSFAFTHGVKYYPCFIATSDTSE